MGNRNINSIVKSDIQWLVDKAYEDHYQHERQNKIKVILSDMFARALEDDLVSKNPCKGVVIRTAKQIKAKALTVEEQEIFFEACKNTAYDNMFHVAVNTGLRPRGVVCINKK